jgi:two-component system cell cycle response regulator
MLLASAQNGRLLAVVSAERQTRDVLLSAQLEHEPDIGNHLKNVAVNAQQLGRRLGLGAEELDVLTRAAELHDIGKIAVPEGILNKCGPLDADEWHLIRQHTLIGERILSSAPAMGSLAEIVRSTHERWDGDGYPDHLAGSQIPFGARIISICDAFDAMTTDRPYRQSRGTHEASAEIRRCSGTQFDPSLVPLLCRLSDADIVNAGSRAGWRSTASRVYS